MLQQSHLDNVLKDRTLIIATMYNQERVIPRN